MSIYVVTYDLNKETKRPNILATIKSLDGWAKLSESSYAVTTSLTSEGVYNLLKKHLDSNDNCYVVSLRRPYNGQGPKVVNDWLENNLPY